MTDAVYINKQTNKQEVSAMYHKFLSAGFRTHNKQIMDSTFCVPVMLILTTEPSPGMWIIIMTLLWI